MLGDLSHRLLVALIFNQLSLQFNEIPDFLFECSNYAERGGNHSSGVCSK